MTPDAYGALEDASDAKYEYHEGYVYMVRPPSSAYDTRTARNMAGGSPAHSGLCGALIEMIGAGLPRRGSCHVHTSDGRIDVDEDRKYYPDVSVVCGRQTGKKSLTNPILIVEVISPDTETKDRGWKFEAYKRLPTLQEYLLVGSTYRSVEVWRRTGDGSPFWEQHVYSMGDTVHLESVDVDISMEDLYWDIEM
jgi:Uma2 family endonuclease